MGWKQETEFKLQLRREKILERQVTQRTSKILCKKEQNLTINQLCETGHQNQILGSGAESAVTKRRVGGTGENSGRKLALRAALSVRGSRVSMVSATPTTQ